MILNGKAKTEFNLWLVKYYELNRPDYSKFSLDLLFRKHNRKTEPEKNSLIIEWFDSVKIRVSIIARITDFGFIVFDNSCDEFYKYHISTRQEATEKAIEKALEIYNSQTP